MAICSIRSCPLDPSALALENYEIIFMTVRLESVGRFCETKVRTTVIVLF